MSCKILSFSLYLFVLISTLSQINCQLCTYEKDVDYLYTEINNQPLFVASTDFCCYACLINAQCQVWTYVPTTRACILKKSIGSNRVASPGRYSGIKQQLIQPTNPLTFPTSPSTSRGSTVAPVTTRGSSTGSTSSSANVSTSSSSVMNSTASNGVPSTSTLATTTKVGSCTVDENANYPGNDMGGKANVTSAFDCCNACSSTVGCMSWSYFLEFNYCYYKSTKLLDSNRQPYQNIYSGDVLSVRK